MNAEKRNNLGKKSFSLASVTLMIFASFLVLASLLSLPLAHAAENPLDPVDWQGWNGNNTVYLTTDFGGFNHQLRDIGDINQSGVSSTQVDSHILNVSSGNPNYIDTTFDGISLGLGTISSVNSLS